MYSNLSDIEDHEIYPFMRLFKITVPNVVGYLKFSRRTHPSYCTTASAVQHLYKTGSVHRRIPLSRATPSSLRIPAKDILGYALAHPESSVRDISKAYSFLKIDGVENITYERCISLSSSSGAGTNTRGLGVSFLFLLNTLDENPDFFNEVSWPDECQFSRQGTINTYNTHYWSLENPHLIRPNRHQVRRLVNVWCGIWKSTLIVPMCFDGLLTSESYTGILSGPLADI
ncbi:uncharacterized protein TNCV_3432041 [Trichonephila clavipes]|nr:uncharacterized protein TNCV_3432041 [Trichonephila clavipes]